MSNFTDPTEGQTETPYVRIFTKQDAGHGIHYSIRQEILDKKYKGCGNGKVTIDNRIDEVVDMDYLDECENVITVQNVSMVEDAGQRIESDEYHDIYIANFSCCEACLF
tara:strand:- start:1636 stop:1962 length:327 start_codon:yes stop_codon:yes gene_type:complete